MAFYKIGNMEFKEFIPGLRDRYICSLYSLIKGRHKSVQKRNQKLVFSLLLCLLVFFLLNSLPEFSINQF